MSLCPRLSLLCAAAIGLGASLGCGGARVEQTPDGGIVVPEELPLDGESARQVVAALAYAVAQQNRDEVRRLFSFHELARAFRPKNVLRLTRTLEGLFVEEMVERIVDPKGRLHRLLDGLEVGVVHVKKGEVVVEARSRAGEMRFHVAHRGGLPRVTRIE